MEIKEHPYLAGTTRCKGYFACPSHVERPPIVVIAPTWEGINGFAKEQAEKLAERGYAAFVADLFGDGKAASSPEEAASLIKPLFIDRKLLRERILAAILEAKKFHEVDSSKVAAMGFCFGGLTVIELMKSGAILKGVVSFHGVLGNELMGITAKLEPTAPEINTSFLLLHGYKDPLVSTKDLLDLEAELAAKNVDWQAHIYGLAAHAFTNPDSHDPAAGMYFEPRTCHRSMMTLYTFLKEIFNE